MGYNASGSSSGCGALVGAGEVEMAIGGDQGGSIRMPASVCGAYGMKPTHGLVPYTGVMPIEPTIDHAGPITGTVRDNALLLEVIAGEARRTETPKARAARSVPKASGLTFTEKHRLEALPGRIDQLTAEIAKLETLLADPDLYTRAPEKFSKASAALAARQTELAAAEEEWLTLAEKAEG